MAGYIQSGEVRARRSPWRLSIIPDTFFALINVVIAFLRTMFSLDAHQSYGKRSDKRRSGSSYGGGGGGPGGPGGGGGGGGPSGGYGRGPRGMDNVRGIDHSAPTATCGSCCG
ncbi:hypothetical protein KC19_1G053200 [Ceratodon purpureus]|uniref:Glycine-rich protein n=1 Tax=Ceratodon purpureus TaxID=3225 RepID=A0A8T0J1P0_CERPU|nr:hypothetical protein KC19_1G053200 [Ceratodon purpureus]